MIYIKDNIDNENNTLKYKTLFSYKLNKNFFYNKDKFHEYHMKLLGIYGREYGYDIRKNYLFIQNNKNNFSGKILNNIKKNININILYFLHGNFYINDIMKKDFNIIEYIKEMKEKDILYIESNNRDEIISLIDKYKNHFYIYLNITELFDLRNFDYLSFQEIFIHKDILYKNNPLISNTDKNIISTFQKYRNIFGDTTAIYSKNKKDFVRF